METIFRPRTLVLFLGDIFFFIFALWLSLFLRTFRVPSEALLASYIPPFLFLFIVWIVVFFIAGLYESRSIIFPRRAISATLFIAQTVNVIFAALFFFLFPVFGIEPKTILFIYLIISFLSVSAWRLVLFPRLGLQKTEAAIVIGEGKEIDELIKVLANAPLAPARVAAVIRPSAGQVSKGISSAVDFYQPRFIIADFSDTRVAAAFPELYNFLSRGIRFFDGMELYEEIFGRVPLSQIDDMWLARNVSRYAHVLYDAVKSLMDILLGTLLGCISLLLYPFIALAIISEDGFPVCIVQDRVGEDNKLVRIYKFRSMSGNDNGKYGVSGSSALHVTKVGAFLRAWRLDELPQLWNVVQGNLSLIGPRLEFPTLVAQYEQSIPYYGVRHLIKPGLSGWAQLYYHDDPHHAANVEATKMKLAYDLYYLKHRSLALDAIIALKTVRRLLIKGNA